jgi:2-polyprenyl-3-methyl-5-hydroxy-6-metoxy-1,4-benzoquinol methylase
MDALYRQTQSDNWENSSAFREEWRIASNWIYQYMKQGSLLDIGCFNGGFLTYMGNNFERFGVEINQNAANLARSKKITIVGSDFNEITNLPYTFDVVVAMDVIEHVENPTALLASMASVLHKGGLLIISTGNTDSLTWKMMGSRYWYCTVAEHISFINPKWCQYMASNLNLKLVQITNFAHLGKATSYQAWADLCKNMFYYLFPAVVSWLRMKGYGGVDATIHKSLSSMPPMWFSAKDHFIVLLQKG